MNDPASFIAIASVGLAATGVTMVAVLRGWREWLEVRRLEIARGGGFEQARSPRSDLHDLKERIRRLEAIANGDH